MDDDVQVVFQLFARWNSGDHSVDPELVDPEVEVYSALALQTFRGYDGGEAWIREIDEQFDDWRVEVDSSRPRGRRGGDRAADLSRPPPRVRLTPWISTSYVGVRSIPGIASPPTGRRSAIT
jgi:hypothetical protein